MMNVCLDSVVSRPLHISCSCRQPPLRHGSPSPCCPDAVLTRPYPKCDQCLGKFCIKHRYPADHECGRLQAGVSSAKTSAAQSRAAQAAMQRHQRKAAAPQSSRCAFGRGCFVKVDVFSQAPPASPAIPRLLTHHFAFSLASNQAGRCRLRAHLLLHRQEVSNYLHLSAW